MHFIWVLIILVLIQLSNFVKFTDAQQSRLFPTKKPTAVPTPIPTMSPITYPPTGEPSGQPSGQPSGRPTDQPTGQPTGQPSSQPTTRPTSSPTITSRPSRSPTPAPTPVPTFAPTPKPTAAAAVPTGQPSGIPTGEPTSLPSGQPTAQPTGAPSGQPSTEPSGEPSGQPSGEPTGVPHTLEPTSIPTTSMPTMNITESPTSQPSMNVSSTPTAQPTSKPSAQPTSRPSMAPIGSTKKPTSQPSGQPSGEPSGQPSTTPTAPPSKAKYNGIDLRTGAVVVDTKDKLFCEPVHFTMKFKFKIPVETPVVMTINTPGVTSGNCNDQTNGLDIENSKLIYSNSDYFVMSFFEGTYTDNFATSYLTIRVLSLGFMSNLTHFNIDVDRSNGLKFYCANPISDWTLNLRGFGELNAFVLNTPMSVSASIPNNYCFWKEANLTFARAHQQFPVAINVSMKAGWQVVSGTQIRVNLPSFTRSLSFPMNHRHYTDGTLTKGTLNPGLIVSASTTESWSGMWYEGNPDNFYSSSYLILTSSGAINSHTDFWIYLSAFPNSISPSCGSIRNSSSFTYKIDSASFDADTTQFDHSSPIGSGCDMLNKCSGHGECDYCSSKCKCFDGYGSSKDISYTDQHTFMPDCSSRRCPLGVSSGNLNSANASMHTLRECSNNGICDRRTAKCECFEGYTGAACQRRPCPGTPFCSGRGSCLPMRDIARESTMFPLQNDIVRRNQSYIPSKNIYNVDVEAWDSEISAGCVCDSSWAVGLGDGETQLAEYFGPSCEYKRCPTGDDPETHTIDETNCQGKSQASDGSVSSLYGATVGEAGNLCHIDCSNRGTCNYNTGRCSCFSGYIGAHCGFVDISAYGNGHTKMSMEVASSDMGLDWSKIIAYDVDTSPARDSSNPFQ